MDFCVVGLNHNVASIEIREKVHFKETDIVNATDILQGDTLKELIVLSTCNRSEIYFLSDDYINDIEKVKAFFHEYFQCPELSFIEKSCDEAIKYLFQVVIGLESIVFGEDQILGQIVDAHLTAIDLGGSLKFMNKVFREAITFAKNIKTITNVSDHATSISYIGVKQIAEQIDLNDKNIIIIGLGNMGQLALVHLLEYESNIFVSNRTIANSVKLKLKYPSIEIIPYEEMNRNLNEMDVLISATSYPGTILDEKDFKELNKDLYIMDLSLPRDIHSNVSENQMIKLYDIDSLSEISKQSLDEKRQILLGFEEDIDTKVQELNYWMANTTVDPILKNVNERCDDIAKDTLNYIYRKTSLSHGEKMKIKKIVESSLKKVMKEPLLALKNMDDSNEKNIAIKVLEELFEQ
ncbi:MAG: glutamyl-tRNA reductase [Tissierellia bacterium]|nr:glutamyl-tRNA reductase [Tissierellia bacterium]